MAEHEGNVLRPPGITPGQSYQPKEILASYARFTQKGVTLLGGQGVLEAGTVLGRVTATKKYKPYASGNSDGTETPLGVLRESVDTGTSAGGNAEDKLGNIVISGILKNSLLIGLDAGAVTALNGRRDLARDYFIF